MAESNRNQPSKTASEDQAINDHTVASISLHLEKGPASGRNLTTQHKAASTVCANLGKQSHIGGLMTTVAAHRREGGWKHVSWSSTWRFRWNKAKCSKLVRFNTTVKWRHWDKCDIFPCPHWHWGWSLEITCSGFTYISRGCRLSARLLYSFIRLHLGPLHCAGNQRACGRIIIISADQKITNNSVSPPRAGEQATGSDWVPHVGWRCVDCVDSWCRLRTGFGSSEYKAAEKTEPTVR